MPGTMFLALYGTDRPSQPKDDGPGGQYDSDQDHFSMFVSRSEAMRWLDDDDGPRLWGMKDAGGKTRGNGPGLSRPLACPH